MDTGMTNYKWKKCTQFSSAFGKKFQLDRKTSDSAQIGSLHTHHGDADGGAIDNDDGSSFYHTHDNFFVYAARGLKSDFGGHDNRHERNVYAFVGGCWENGNADHFVNNTCIANSPAGGFGSDCTKGPLMVVSGNTIYNEDGTLNGTKLCDTTNHIAGKWPAADDIVKLGRAVLGFSASGA